MPQTSDSWREAVTSDIKLLKDKIVSINDIDTLLQKSEERMMRALKQEIQNTLKDFEISVQFEINKKAEELTANFDEKISKIKDDIAESSNKQTIKDYHAANEGLRNYHNGIFIPDLQAQFAAMSSDIFSTIFKGKFDAMSDYQLAQNSIQFITTVIGDNVTDSALYSILTDGLLLETSLVFGKKTKNLLLKMSTVAAADKVRSALIEFNARSSASKKPGIRFSRLKTGIESVDYAMTTASSVLYAAKKYKLISAYSTAPKLSPDRCNLLLTTKVRYPGDTSFNNLAWSTQTPDQAKSDLLSLLSSPDPEAVKNFTKFISDMNVKSKENATRVGGRKKAF